MKTLLMIFYFLAGVLSSLAQEAPIHNFSMTPADAKFEIVQSQIAARWTFRLNRYSGQVSMLVKDSEGKLLWEPMQIVNLVEVPETLRPHFQIFLSGIIAQNSFLLDVDSGRTWILTTITEKNKETETMWMPLRGE
jgi:hypothetical protein